MNPNVREITWQRTLVEESQIRRRARSFLMSDEDFANAKRHRQQQGVLYPNGRTETEESKRRNQALDREHRNLMKEIEVGSRFLKK